MINQGENNGGVMTFVADGATSTISLTDISVGVFTWAVQNIATLRATTVRPCQGFDLLPTKCPGSKATLKLPMVESSCGYRGRNTV